MGCFLAPMDRRPEDASVVVYAPVTQLFVGRYKCTSGLAYVEQDLFRYTDYWGRKIVNVYVKDIQSVSVQTAYRDRGSHIRPCLCCPCAGCPDGVLDIRGTMTQGGVPAMIGKEFHIGLAMPDPEDFMEKLKAEINRCKMDS